VRLGNGARLAGRALGSAWSRPAFPYKLTFVATERCNLRCGMCRIWDAGGVDPPLDGVREFFARSNRFSWIDVTGGEIFLRDDIPELFETIRVHCRQLALLHFPTNGYLVDRVVEVARELLRGNPPRVVVTVSIDGPPAVHDAMRGAAGSFDRAVETFARLTELPGCRTVLGMTLSDSNLGLAGETESAVRRRLPRGARVDLHVNLPNRSGHYYRNEGAPLPGAETLSAGIRAIRRRRGVPADPLGLVESRLLALGERFLRTGRCPIPCQALSASCFVGANGTVYPCATWGRPLGTLAENGHDLGRIWNSPSTAAVREQIARGECPQCWTACEAVPALAARWGTFRP
jgi:MoaA/NifB/PqqE/SkfB family radical SAM enzyme